MQIVEGTRVRLTKPMGIWIGHMRLIEGSAALPHNQYIKEARDYGYWFEREHGGWPHIPEGATGTIYEFEMYNVWLNRQAPSYIKNAKTPELQDKLYKNWLVGDDPGHPPQYPVEHIIRKGEKPPESGVYSWTMWGIEFDKYPVAENTLAGLGDPEELPDYLEVIDDED